MTKPQQRRALELLRKCLESGCIAHGYKDREPSRCLGDEIIEFLEKVDSSTITRKETS